MVGRQVVQPGEHPHRLASRLRCSSGSASNSQPAIVYGRDVGRHDAVDPPHQQERRAEPLGVGLVRDHLGHGDVGVLADRLHDPPLQLEVVLREHRELLRRERREPGDEALRRARRPGCTVNSSVSLDMPLPSGAVTSVTVAPGAIRGSTMPRCGRSWRRDRCATVSRWSVPRWSSSPRHGGARSAPAVWHLDARRRLTVVRTVPPVRSCSPSPSRPSRWWRALASRPPAPAASSAPEAAGAPGRVRAHAGRVDPRLGRVDGRDRSVGHRRQPACQRGVVGPQRLR